jgi:hypothetical protein
VIKPFVNQVWSLQYGIEATCIGKCVAKQAAAPDTRSRAALKCLWYIDSNGLLTSYVEASGSGEPCRYDA